MSITVPQCGVGINDSHWEGGRGRSRLVARCGRSGTHYRRDLCHFLNGIMRQSSLYASFATDCPASALSMVDWTSLG
eukprot:6486062-Amphidinium_carterae.1